MLINQKTLLYVGEFLPLKKLVQVKVPCTEHAIAHHHLQYGSNLYAIMRIVICTTLSTTTSSSPHKHLLAGTSFYNNLHHRHLLLYSYLANTPSFAQCSDAISTTFPPNSTHLLLSLRFVQIKIALTWRPWQQNQDLVVPNTQKSWSSAGGCDV